MMVFQVCIAIMTGLTSGCLFALVSIVGIELVFLSQLKNTDERIPRRNRLWRSLWWIPVPQVIVRHGKRMEVSTLLLHAGLSWKEEEYGVVRWISFLVSIIVGLIVAYIRHWDPIGLFLLCVTIFFGVSTPNFWIRWQIERRKSEIDHGMPDMLDRLILCLDAGLGFENSLRRIAPEIPGLLGDEICKVLRYIDMGLPRRVALANLADRNPSEALKGFVSGVRQSDRLGNPLAKTLQVQSRLLRSRRRRKAEEAGRRLPILIVFPLVFLFLPALLIIFLAPPILHLFMLR